MCIGGEEARREEDAEAMAAALERPDTEKLSEAR